MKIPIYWHAGGRLDIRQEGRHLAMGFPARPAEPVDTVPALAAALGATPEEEVGREA